MVLLSLAECENHCGSLHGTIAKSSTQTQHIIPMKMHPAVFSREK